MKLAITAAVLVLSIPMAASAQTSRPAPQQRGAAAAPADHVAEAYNQFLLAHRLEQDDNVDGAISAYKRAGELDPLAADVPAELAALYLRQNKLTEAVASAEQAVKIAPLNREAHRVLGIAYASMIDNATIAAGRGNADNVANADENLKKAIEHLEIAIEKPIGESDPNVRATLARLYIRAGTFDKSIALLSDLVRQEAAWQEGPLLLLDSYMKAGRDKEAIAWLEETTKSEVRLLPALAQLYERNQQWKEAADTYATAIGRAPNNVDLKSRYASVLMTLGGKSDVTTARDLLVQVVAARQNDVRSHYLLSQAYRRLGDLTQAEAMARRVITLQRRSPWGYYALAETLEERRDYAAVVQALTPAIDEIRNQKTSTNPTAQNDLGMLLPHLGFAYQELGQLERAITTFDEAHKLAPNDSAITGYLIEANIVAKRYSVALDLARQARAVDGRGGLRFARLEADVLRRVGKRDQGVAVLEDAVKEHADEPAAYVALAQLYADAERGPQAIKLLEEAGEKFPTDSTIVFELGAVLDKQKKYVEAEAAFQKLLARDPENAAALNYLGYMLAERGERLDESVDLLKKALEFEPNNGSYLDSIGWAYYKANKLDLAESNLKRAAEQLKTNSVIQDHYGDLLYKMRRYDDAIAAWTRALAGDSEAVDRLAIDKKLRAAKKLVKK